MSLQQIYFLSRRASPSVRLPSLSQFRSLATSRSASHRTPLSFENYDPNLTKQQRLIRNLRARAELDPSLNRESIVRALTSIEDADDRHPRDRDDYRAAASPPPPTVVLPTELGGGLGTDKKPLHVQNVQTKWQNWITIAQMAGMFAILYVLFNRAGGILGDEFGDIYEEYDKYGNKVLSKKGVVSKLVPEETDGKKQRKPSNLLTFDDVAGCEEAKSDLQDIIAYLKSPGYFKKMGIDLPRGVLVTGPPGCGKTLLARAMAGEAGVPFLITDGASFDQMFVGLGSSRVRSLFKRARELAPCIVFIDEIDAVASRRDEPRNPTRATLNQLLVELDGFKKDSGVIIMGATNLPEILDHALTRPGRFDRTVKVDLPDKETRRKVLTMYLKNNAAPDVNIEALAAGTTGFSGADLKNLVNLAGIETVKQRLAKISMAALDDAKEILMMGRARKSMILTPETKRITAFHEGGHALVSVLTEGGDPIYKATLVPRGGALGMVTHIPKEDLLASKESLLHFLDTAMAGRAAEELIFGVDKITGGAASDFEKATKVATEMVTRLGMSERVGPVHYKKQDLDTLSPAMKDLIAEEVRKILETSYARVSNLLKKRQPQLTALAHALLEKETLTIEEIKKVIRFNPKDMEPPANSSKSSFKLPSDHQPSLKPVPLTS